MTDSTEKKIHQGRNVKRFREMRGLKQEAFAMEMGEDWNQKKVSLLEAKEEIEPELLELVASALKMPVEAFTNLDDDSAINIISNTVNNHDNAMGNSLINYYPIINPIDKWMEALEENKKLMNEKVELYERLLRSEREKVELLQKK